VDWRTPEGEALIYLSSKAVFAPPKVPTHPPVPPTPGAATSPTVPPGSAPRPPAPGPTRPPPPPLPRPQAIRGGTPICFPQFSDMGPVASSHGFARNHAWRVVEQGADSVTMRLPASPEQAAALRELWPHDFELDLTTALAGPRLTQTLTVRNAGSAPFQFTACFHNYLLVSDVRQARVRGLAGHPHMDNLFGRMIRPAAGGAEDDEGAALGGETDRIYLGAGGGPGAAVVDRAGGRAVTVSTDGVPDLVLWNPWAAKAAAMGDMGDSDYERFVCLEPAVSGSGPRSVAPGGAVTLRQTLGVERL